MAEPPPTRRIPPSSRRFVTIALGVLVGLGLLGLVFQEW